MREKRNGGKMDLNPSKPVSLYSIIPVSLGIILSIHIRSGVRS
jgi:hypothetical protein